MDYEKIDTLYNYLLEFADYTVYKNECKNLYDANMIDETLTVLNCIDYVKKVLLESRED